MNNKLKLIEELIFKQTKRKKRYEKLVGEAKRGGEYGSYLLGYREDELQKTNLALQAYKLLIEKLQKQGKDQPMGSKSLLDLLGYSSQEQKKLLNLKNLKAANDE